MSPLTSHQIKALQKLRPWVAGWERANFPGMGKLTWDKLVELGYVEERREGSSRFVRLTEMGMRVVDEADEPKVS